jgi:hypothetical protein
MEGSRQPPDRVPLRSSTCDPGPVHTAMGAPDTRRYDAVAAARLRTRSGNRRTKINQCRF